MLDRYTLVNTRGSYAYMHIFISFIRDIHFPVKVDG